MPGEAERLSKTLTRSPALALNTPLTYLKGVGPHLASVFASRGLHIVEDLLQYLPFRYEDRTHVVNRIRDLVPGQTATIIATVQSVATLRTRKGMRILQMMVTDGMRHLECTWFNSDYLRDRFHPGQQLALYGRVERERNLTMRQPQFEVLGDSADVSKVGDLAPSSSKVADLARQSAADDIDSLKLGRIVPIYEGIGPISSAKIRVLIARALRDIQGVVPDALPASIRERLRLPARADALDQAHFPAHDTAIDLLQQARTPAQMRLIFEELFFLQTGLELKRRRVLQQAGIRMEVTDAIRERLKQVLPFHPTQDQKQALREIVDDMRSGRPMRRLLQGDVGSGKTIVALQAAVVAIENGYRVALMAPTQILASQHFLYARDRLPGYGVELVTGGASTMQRRQQSARLGSDAAHLLIGTQALLEERLGLDRLGLVIVDEQHRFGVMQRFTLMRKGELPAHVLVMTATPIPRTLALSLYGDLDVSWIRQLPPGRLPVRTRVVSPEKTNEMYEFVRKQLQSGRQAYFVYPVIEESEALNLKPAIRMAELLRSVFAEYKVGLLHGRMPNDEKQAIMLDFKAGRIHVLVSTTVIEVGVDVPNATVMVVEQAERFGIAQLHQLRGRIGRPQRGRTSGSSYCFLVVGEAPTDLARRRLEALEKTTDGFELAELDLKLRGPGEFFGTRQSGLPAFEIADPLRDQELMQLARNEARQWLDNSRPDERAELVGYIRQRWQRRYGLVEVG